MYKRSVHTQSWSHLLQTRHPYIYQPFLIWQLVLVNTHTYPHPVTLPSLVQQVTPLGAQFHLDWGTCIHWRGVIGNLGCYRSRGVVTLDDMLVSCSVLRDGERDSEVRIYCTLDEDGISPQTQHDCTPLALANPWAVCKKLLSLWITLWLSNEQFLPVKR